MKLISKNLLVILILASTTILYPSFADIFAPTPPEVLELLKRIEQVKAERGKLQSEHSKLESLIITQEMSGKFAADSKRKEIENLITSYKTAIETQRAHIAKLKRDYGENDSNAKIAIASAEKSMAKNQQTLDSYLKQAPENAVVEKQRAEEIKQMKAQLDCLDQSIKYVQRIINTLEVLRKTTQDKIDAEKEAQRYKAHFESQEQSEKSKEQEEAEEKAVGEFNLTRVAEFIKKYQDNPKAYQRIASKEPHKILGIAQNFTEDDVKKAFRGLSLLWHPDRYKNEDPNKKTAQEVFKIIGEANATALKILPKKPAAPAPKTQCPPSQSAAAAPLKKPAMPKPAAKPVPAPSVRRLAK